MPKCSFCQKNYPVHRGITFVEVSGKILHFCSSKCIKNWKLGRDAKRCKWIKKQKKEIKKEVK